MVWRRSTSSGANSRSPGPCCRSVTAFWTRVRIPARCSSRRTCWPAPPSTRDCLPGAPTTPNRGLHCTTPSNTWRSRPPWARTRGCLATTGRHWPSGSWAIQTRRWDGQRRRWPWQKTRPTALAWPTRSSRPPACTSTGARRSRHARGRQRQSPWQRRKGTSTIARQQQCWKAGHWRRWASPSMASRRSNGAWPHARRRGR